MLFNKQRFQKLMEKYGFDALVASTPQNVLYSSDFYSNTHWMRYYDSQVYVVLPREKGIEPAIIVPVNGISFYSLSSFPSWINDIRTYGRPNDTLNAELKMTQPEFKSEFYGIDADVSEILARTLQDKSLSNKKIGFDELDVPLFERMKKELPDARVVMADGIFKELKMVKSDNEILRLSKVVEVVEKGFRAAVEGARPEISVKEVVAILAEVISKEGGTPISLGVRGGRNMSGGEHKLEKNDILYFDMVGSFQYYLSDIGRTVILNSPSDKVKKYYNAMFRGQEEALKALRPGVKASEVFNVAVEAVKREGIPHYQRGACGHGIGIGWDRPMIAPGDDTPIEENMVLCIETPYREMGFGGLMLEDTVIVTKGGTRFLTTTGRNLCVI
jgi:Xaa-Pro aminopeptidase